MATEGLQFKLLALSHFLFFFGVWEIPGTRSKAGCNGIQEAFVAQQSGSVECWTVSAGVPSPAVLSWEGAPQSRTFA